MRVIRTELYFDDGSVRASNRNRVLRAGRPLKEEENQGIAFVWFRNEGEIQANIRNYKWFRGRPVEAGQVRQALDYLLRDSDERELLRASAGEDLINPQIVDFILEQDVVIEKSPPIAIPFKSLLKKTNSTLLVGSYMGYAIAGENPLLLLVTVPGGIIAVGSALGIADAMAHGLNKRIKDLFKRK